MDVSLRASRAPTPSPQSGARWCAITFLVVCVSVQTGCSLFRGGGGPGGSLQTRGLSDQPVLLKTNYVTAYYHHQADVKTTFYLSDVPLEALLDGDFDEGQIIHIDLLWIPKPGKTPIDSSAANINVRQVLITGNELGIYGGAGFAMPSGGLDGKSASLSVREATIRLIESTDGFSDLLSPALLTGRFRASQDKRTTRQIGHAVNQIVTNTLGRTRYVRNDGSAESRRITVATTAGAGTGPGGS